MKKARPLHAPGPFCWRLADRASHHSAPMAAHGFHSVRFFRIVSVKKHEKHLHTGQIPTNISRAIELRNYFSVR